MKAGVDILARFVPPEIIEEIRQKADIVEVVSGYVSLKKQGRNFVGLCPFHSEDTPSFVVSPDKQIFYCFGCQHGGNVINFVMEQESLTLPEAAEKLADQYGVTIPEAQYSQKDISRQHKKKTFYDMYERAAGFYQQMLLKAPEGAAGRAYLAGRGLDQKIIADFKLGYSPAEPWDGLYQYLSQAGFRDNDMIEAGLISKSSKNQKCYDKFRNRVMYPILDYKGQFIAFGGRVLDQELPKYLNSQDSLIFNKSENLYGLFVAGPSIRKENCAVIMEGYMDVLTAHQHGVANAVASLGTAFTPEHGRLLKRYTDHVILAYDGDGAGIKATVRGIDILREQGFTLKIVSFPDGQDPDDFLKANGKAGWQDLVAQKSLGVLDFKLNLALKKYDSEKPEGKGAIVKELLPDMAKCSSLVERDSFIALVAGRLDVPPESIYADLQKNGYRIDGPRGRRPRNPAAVPKQRRREMQVKKLLLRLMLENKAIWQMAEEELSVEQWADETIVQLLQTVRDSLDDYDWQLANLLTGLAGEPLSLGAEILAEDMPAEDIEELAASCIRAIKVEHLQREVEKSRGEFEKIKGDATQELILLQEISVMQKEIQRLNR